MIYLIDKHKKLTLEDRTIYPFYVKTKQEAESLIDSNDLVPVGEYEYTFKLMQHVKNHFIGEMPKKRIEPNIFYTPIYSLNETIRRMKKDKRTKSFYVSEKDMEIVRQINKDLDEKFKQINKI